MTDNDGPKRFDLGAINLQKADEEAISSPTEREEPLGRRTRRRQSEPDASSTSDTGAAAAAPESFSNLSSLGSDLARVMQDDYHPVVLFGTNNSGKTSVLMSLFATLINEPILDTGLSLCDPILGARSEIGQRLHKEAEHTFHIKTQSFLAGEKIPKTSTPLPFFIPVEFRPPDGRPPVKFAFLESNGEWYRPLISDGRKFGDVDKLYPDLRNEIEGFIAGFQNGITFIYTAPVTQGEVYAAAENAYDATEINYASLAIKGVLQTYDRIRANGRSNDRHLLLLTKWDALSTRDSDRAAGIEEDSVEVLEFCHKKYGQALAAFQGLNLDKSQRNINAYCAGMINERGLLPLKHDAAVRGVIASYPVRLWTYLYKNALSAANEHPVAPFRSPPGRPAIVKFFHKILDRISG